MRPLDGFPTSFGSERACVFPHAGPASYTRITYSPTANGDTVEAVEAGLKYFDYLVGGMTDSGNFSVRAEPVVSSVGPTGSAATTYRLKWIAEQTATVGGQSQTTQTEAAASTDLSGEVVRLFALGPKS